MSRIGMKPVAIPSGVTVEVAGRRMSVQGKKGKLELELVDEIDATVDGSVVRLKPREDTMRGRMMWGMQRTLVNNMVQGVTNGYEVDLDIIGVGYRAAVQGRNLNLQLGYSHDVVFPIPEGIEIKCEKPTAVRVSGIDKQKVGQVAAVIRGFRKPEPYKGKGIKYSTETVHRKEGKKK